MRPGSVPSYLFLSRHGIYYFRCRIPLSVAKKYNFSKTEIRKSLHTSNRVDAIRKARRMWLEYIDDQFLYPEKTVMSGIPKDKYDLMLSIPKALNGIRENIGKHGVNVKISWLDSYIAKIGDDPDVITELMQQLTEDEKKALSDMQSFKRALLILKLKTNPPSNIPIPSTDANNQSSETQYAPPKQVKKNKKKSIKLDTLVNQYLDLYKIQYLRNKQTDSPKNSFTENKRPLTTFAAILGNIEPSSITKQHIKDYVDLSFRLPARLNKLPGFTHISTNEEILSIYRNKLDQMDLNGYAKKANGSLSKEFNIVSNFLKWLHLEDHLDRDFSGFLPSVSVSSTKKEKPMLTENDYKLFFNSDHYVHGKHKKPSDFWIPLIGIFTGCRIEEIASLFKEDIYIDKDTNFFVFDINENLAIKKRRKTENSTRCIPIHDQLKKLGLIDYVEKLPKKSQLFPELKPNSDGRFSTTWGNAFNRYHASASRGNTHQKKDGTQSMSEGLLVKCGIEKKIVHPDGRTTSKSFHSLRHYFINEIDKMDANDRFKNYLVGHAYKGARVPNYIHFGKDDKLALYELIKQIRYPSIDFSLIRKIDQW
jgi:integrase